MYTLSIIVNRLLLQQAATETYLYDNLEWIVNIFVVLLIQISLIRVHADEVEQTTLQGKYLHCFVAYAIPITDWTHYCALRVSYNNTSDMYVNLTNCN